MAAPSESAPPGWMLDEQARAGRENLDAEHVAHYDEKEDAGAAEEVALLVDLGLDQASTLVDLGAGTGQLSLAVAPECGRVVAVDISPVMVGRLRAKVSDSGLANVEVVQAGFLSYEHSGPPVDVVYSRWALHHLPDFWKSVALQRMRPMLRTGGLLRLSDIVYSFNPSEAEDRLEAWCATLSDRSDGGAAWVRADIEDHVRDEHSTYSWLLEPMVERSGFQIEQVDHSPDQLFARYVARAV